MRQFEVLMPECYSSYSCKGGDCRYSCCSGWDISFDDADRKMLLKKGTASRDQIYRLNEERQKGSCIYAIILNKNGDCPFLTEERLCKIQLDHSEKSMPAICREFPHIYHQYLNKLELGLSLGCEKVLELLYEENDGIQFVNKIQLLPDYQRISSITDAKSRNKHAALIYYYDIQSLFLGILQAKDAKIEERMILLGMAIFHIDSLVNEGNHHQIPSYINKFINDMGAIDAGEYLKNINTENIGVLCSNITIILNFMEYAEGRDTRCKELIEKIMDKLNVKKKSESRLEFSVDSYHQCRNDFLEFIEGKEHFLENVAAASMFHFNTPFYNRKSGVWRDYTYFVWTFSMVKFSMTVLLDKNSSISDMIDCCAIMFRRLGHNTRLYDYIINNLETTESNSVAHMAVLLKSC